MKTKRIIYNGSVCTCPMNRIDFDSLPETITGLMFFSSGGSTWMTEMHSTGGHHMPTRAFLPYKPAHFPSTVLISIGYHKASPA